MKPRIRLERADEVDGEGALLAVLTFGAALTWAFIFAGGLL